MGLDCDVYLKQKGDLGGTDWIFLSLTGSRILEADEELPCLLNRIKPRTKQKKVK